jgi:chromosome segregation ATPase
MDRGIGMRSDDRNRGRLLRRAGVVGVGLILLFGAISGAGQLRERAEHAQVQATLDGLRGQIRSVRAELDACLLDVEELEVEFRIQERTTEGLREEIENYEGLDERGVPASEYQAYLEVFDLYNESLPEWERRAEALQAKSLRCRELAEEHNRWTDSLRAFVVDAGLWDEEWEMPQSRP